MTNRSPFSTDTSVPELPQGRARAEWSRRLAAALSDARHRLVIHAPVVVDAFLRPRHRDAFGIFVYHRTSPEIKGVASPTWNVRPERFRQQMQGLLARGYEPWPLRKAIAFHRQRRPIPRNVFVVTFDDGYASNYHFAWPILKELKIPATIFLATAHLDSRQPFPFDDWSAAGRDRVPSTTWKPLTTVQCREMLEDGLVELGAHTHTHADFRGRPESLQRDLALCLDVLQDRFGLADAAFALPYGVPHLGFASPELISVARELGVLCCLSTESELVTPRADRFAWGRFSAASIDSAATLAAKLGGWYSWLRKGMHTLDVRRKRKHWAAGLPHESSCVAVGLGTPTGPSSR